MLSKVKINKIFTILEANNPTPVIELKYSCPFTLLIAIMLSAQSTDKMVNLVTDQLFLKYNQPVDFIELGLEKLREHIKKIGLSNTKAKNIIKMCNILILKYNGLVPSTYKELISLPGVGRKSADVLLNSYFKKPTIAVDCHVFRVANRLGIVIEKNILKMPDKILKVIPRKWHFYAHHWLVLHGRYICKAQSPKCIICPLSPLCLYYNSKNI